MANVLSTLREVRPALAKNVRVSSPGAGQVIAARQAEQRERAVLADLREALDGWQESAARDEDALARIEAIRKRWGIAERPMSGTDLNVAE